MISELATITNISKACELLSLPRSQAYRGKSIKEESPKSEEIKTNKSSEKSIQDSLNPFSVKTNQYKPENKIKKDLTRGVSGGSALPLRSESNKKRALSQEEKEKVLNQLDSEKFMDDSPRAVWSKLLEEGKYLCSWRTMYRILNQRGKVVDRRNQRNRNTRKAPNLEARKKNEIWSWDITYIASRVKGVFYYLYVVLDVFSRYVVGWRLARVESGEIASELIGQSCMDHDVETNHLILHSDRGSPMKSKAVGDLLEDLGITKSHSRPRVSNDNAHSEAQFKTLKYHKNFPSRFNNFEECQAWMTNFFDWYNKEHRHSGIGLLTPEQVYQNKTKEIQQKRQEVLLQAAQRHPERFVNGLPQPPQIQQVVRVGFHRHTINTNIPTPTAPRS